MFSLVLCHILVYVIPVYVAIGFIRSSLCCSGLCRGKVYVDRDYSFGFMSFRILVSVPLRKIHQHRNYFCFGKT